MSIVQFSLFKLPFGSKFLNKNTARPGTNSFENVISVDSKKNIDIGLNTESLCIKFEDVVHLQSMLIVVATKSFPFEIHITAYGARRYTQNESNLVNGNLSEVCTVANKVQDLGIVAFANSHEVPLGTPERKEIIFTDDNDPQGVKCCFLNLKFVLDTEDIDRMQPWMNKVRIESVRCIGRLSNSDMFSFYNNLGCYPFETYFNGRIFFDEPKMISQATLCKDGGLKKGKLEDICVHFISELQKLKQSAVHAEKYSKAKHLQYCIDRFEKYAIEYKRSLKYKLRCVRMEKYDDAAHIRDDMELLIAKMQKIRFEAIHASSFSFDKSYGTGCTKTTGGGDITHIKENNEKPYFQESIQSKEKDITISNVSTDTLSQGNCGMVEVFPRSSLHESNDVDQSHLFDTKHLKAVPNENRKDTFKEYDEKFQVRKEEKITNVNSNDVEGNGALPNNKGIVEESPIVSDVKSTACSARNDIQGAEISAENVAAPNLSESENKSTLYEGNSKRDVKRSDVHNVENVDRTQKTKNSRSVFSNICSIF